MMSAIEISRNISKMTTHIKNQAKFFHELERADDDIDTTFADDDVDTNILRDYNRNNEALVYQSKISKRPNKRLVVSYSGNVCLSSLENYK